jgi:hypothetical protein
MSERAHQLVQILLQKQSLDECSLQDLQSLAREYPYFGAIQLLLAEKTRTQHPSVYQKQLQKTALFFHDPYWFDYLINEQDYQQEEIIVEPPHVHHDELSRAIAAEDENEEEKPTGTDLAKDLQQQIDSSDTPQPVESVPATAETEAAPFESLPDLEPQRKNDMLPEQEGQAIREGLPASSHGEETPVPPEEASSEVISEIDVHPAGVG